MTEILFNATWVRNPIAEKSEDWQETAYQWKVCINNQYFDFYTGSAWVNKNRTPKKPSLDDVLHSLLLDSDANDMSFDDWCSNFGYDTDSRKALDTYLACQENSKKLIKAGIDIAFHKERLQDY